MPLCPSVELTPLLYFKVYNPAPSSSSSLYPYPIYFFLIRIPRCRRQFADRPSSSDCLCFDGSVFGVFRIFLTD